MVIHGTGGDNAVVVGEALETVCLGRELAVTDLLTVRRSDAILEASQKRCALHRTRPEPVVATLSSSPAPRNPAKVGVFCVEVKTSARFFLAMHRVGNRS